jgi:GAF domain-containing protein
MEAEGPEPGPAETAIANTESRASLARLAEEQVALRRVATLVADGAAPEQVFAAVTEELARLVPVDAAAMARYEPDGTQIYVASWGKAADFIPVGSRWTLDGENVATAVFETGRPARVDSQADATGSLADLIRNMGIRSLVGTAVVVEGRLWGQMGAGSTLEEPLPPDAEARLASFTELVATAIANAESRTALARVAEEQAALRRVATLVAQATPPEAVFAAVVAEAGRLLDVDTALLNRYDPGDSVTLVGAWTTTGGVPPTPLGSQLPIGEHNVTTLVFQTGQAQRTDDTSVSGVIGGVTRDWGLRSSVGVPIRVEGRLWGVMIVGSAREELLPADTEKQLVGFAELVATAIANTQARTELRGVAEEQASLRRVATLVAQAAPAEGDVFAAVAEEVGRLLGVDAAVLARYDPRDTVTVVGVWNSTGAVPPTPVGSQSPLGGSNISTLVFRTGQAARIDYAAASGVIRDIAVRDWGWRAAVGVPIRVEGRLWGVVVVTLTHIESLPADTEARLAGFTELLATAIANAESRAALGRLAEEQAALRRVATLVAAGAPPEEVFAAVAEEAGRLLEAHQSWTARYDPDGARTVVASWSSTGAGVPVGSRARLWGRNLSTLVFHTAQPARIDDYADASGPPADFSRAVGIRASVGVPISVEGRLWGVMVVASAQEPMPAGTEVRLAGFTELAATAIANAGAQAEVVASRARIVAAADEARRRIERDLHDGIQQRLVTQALMLSGIRDRVPADVRADVDELREELAATRRELRDLSQGVHPSILVEVGLGAAIRALARRSPLPVRVHMGAEDRLPSSAEITAYYVAAEAFTNAAKHANASAVDILIEEADGTLTVQVRDDGVGGADASRGSGLTGLRDRVEAVGGSMTLDSTAGAGTVLTVVLPPSSIPG